MAGMPKIAELGHTGLWVNDLARMKDFYTRVVGLTVTGLALGGIYALVALGYTMVYGVLQLINFAHSEVFMYGTFAVAWVFVFFHGTE